MPFEQLPRPLQSLAHKVPVIPTNVFTRSARNASVEEEEEMLLGSGKEFEVVTLMTLLETVWKTHFWRKLSR